MTTYGSVQVPAGARGFDALGDPATPARLARDGWAFRTFYIAQESDYSTKITDATRAAASARITAHLDAGLGVLLNFESSTNRPRSGAAGGRADGVWSRQLCADLGYPRGLPVIVSYDTDIRVDGRVDPATVAYGEAFADALDGWKFGVYGGTPIMHELAHRCDCNWQAMASSWSSGRWPNAVVHMKQRRPSGAETAAMPYATRKTLDVNVTVGPVAMWRLLNATPDPVPAPLRISSPIPSATATPTTPPTPAPLEEDDMADPVYIVRTIAGHAYVTDMKRFAHALREDSAAQLRDRWGRDGIQVADDTGPLPLDERDSQLVEDLCG